MRKSIIVLLSLAFIVGACAPAESPEDVQARILAAVEATLAAQGQIGTSVALTIEAQNPSATPMPAATGVPFSTFTPLPTVTPLAPPSGGGGGGGGSSGSSGGSTGSTKYSCAIISEKPNDGATFKPGDSFDKSWTIKNTGTATWTVGWEFEYLSGTDMSPTANRLLTAEVKPGKTITLVIEVEAPLIDKKDTGKIFIMKWSLNNGTHYCTPYVAIRVVYPGTDP